MQAVGPLTRAAAKSPFVSPCEPGLSCWPPTVSRISRSPHSSVSRGSWWPAGARAFSKAASPALQKTPHGPVVHLPSRSRKYSRSSTRPPARNRPTPPTGAAAPWPPRPASALPPWDGFGAPMASSPTASRPSSSAMTRVSPRNSTTSSDSISIRLSMLWFSRSMRSPKSKPSIAPNPACRSKRDAAKR